MKLKWLGWASWLITIGDKTIAIDPFKGEIENSVDIILISHGHPDHLDKDKISKIRTENSIVLTPSQFATDINAETLNVGDEKLIDNIKIIAVDAYNLQIPNHPKGVGVGFIIEAEGKRIYFAGDTDLIEEMKNLKDIDYALLPIGGTYTMDLDDAVKAISYINPKHVIPMHFGEVQVFMHGKTLDINLAADPELFKKQVEENTTTKVQILKHDEEISF